MALKTFNIAGIELKDRYVQAPLAGFSTITMRNFAHRYGAGLSYTEMISANALFYGSQDTFEMLHDTQRDEGPLALQLFGYEIDHIEKAIEIVENKNEGSKFFPSLYEKLHSENLLVFYDYV